MIRRLLLAVVLALSLGCAPAQTVSAAHTTATAAEFTTDGCSGLTFAVWKAVAGPPEWESDCIEHDRAYWRGGTPEERQAADLKLRQALEQRGHPILGAAMYYGVRIGGVSWLPTSWRWGYGQQERAR